MRVIALQGKSNTGKTTTLKRMILTIIQNNIFDTTLIDNLAKIIKKCLLSTGDVKCMFTYKNIKIGVTTRGDARRFLEYDFNEFFKGCDIVVCAVHTSGETIEYIREKGNDGILIHTKWFVETNDIKTIEKVNLIQSNFLINEIKRVAKERKI